MIGMIETVLTFRLVGILLSEISAVTFYRQRPVCGIPYRAGTEDGTGAEGPELLSD